MGEAVTRMAALSPVKSARQILARTLVLVAKSFLERQARASCSTLFPLAMWSWRCMTGCWGRALMGVGTDAMEVQYDFTSAAR